MPPLPTSHLAGLRDSNFLGESLPPGGGLLSLPHRHGAHVVVVVAVEQLHAPFTVESEHVRTYPIEEVAIVGDTQNGAVEA